MTLTLPYPPSVNRYWRHQRGRHHIAADGKAFRLDVLAIVKGERVRPFTGRLRVLVDVYPPDRRRRDLDNLPKALLDALEKAGVYADDEQIDWLELRRRAVEPPGRVEVEIQEI